MFRATVTDTAGNTSACSTSSVTYVEDSTAPARPDLAAGAARGPANDNTPEVIGAAEAGSTVKSSSRNRLLGHPGRQPEARPSSPPRA